jgi:hypothetical protein
MMNHHQVGLAVRVGNAVSPKINRSILESHGKQYYMTADLPVAAVLYQPHLSWIFSYSVNATAHNLYRRVQHRPSSQQ